MNNLHLLKENAMQKTSSSHNIATNNNDIPEEEEPTGLNFVLYVWGNQEKCSRTALATAQQTSAIDVINVVDARDLTMKEIPSWLNGVPTLLSVEDMSVYRGTECLNEIERIGDNVDSYRPILSISEDQPSRGGNHFTMPRAMELPPQIPRDPEQQSSLDIAMMEPRSEKKSDAEDLKKEVEQIMKRREQLMNGGVEQANDGR